MKSFIANKEYLNDIQICLQSILKFDSLKETSILVTGATGLIGSFLVDVLMIANTMWNSNIEVFALGRNKLRLQNRFFYFKEHPHLHFIEQDITKNLLDQLPYVDYIIHAASNAYPNVMYEKPVDTIMANVQGTYQLLNYLHEVRGKRFLFLSTGEIYGQAVSDEMCFEENYAGYIAQLNVRSSYPLSKRLAENLCVSYSKQYGIDTVIARLSHTYGPNNTSVDDRANAQFVENAISNHSIVLKSKGGQIRSYTYIADAISGLLTILISGKSNEAYNVSNPSSIVSIAQFAQLVAKCGCASIQYEFEDSRPALFDRAVLSSRKLQALGWIPKFDICTGIQHTLRIKKWLRE